jgi:hypothetical protein
MTSLRGCWRCWSSCLDNDPDRAGHHAEAGGESATGWATALQLASEGFFVLVHARDKR